MTQDLSPAEQGKAAAARAALNLIEPGMRLGLGTGSTAFWLVKFLGEQVRRGFDVTCVPTSSVTRAQAMEEGVNVTTLDQLGHLDLTIDGADEFDPELNLIKGGGGALLQEKIVATASDRMVVIADPSKEVHSLGAFPLPVEVVRFGWGSTQAQIASLLAEANLPQSIVMRQKDDAPFVTDEGHYILDLHLERIPSPSALALMLNRVPGVVETGLFIDIADAVIVGRPDGTADMLELETQDEL